MIRRTIPLAVALSLLLASCGGAEDVPEDQVVKPGGTPSEWTSTEFATVTVSTPPEWKKQPEQQQTQTMASTTFRAAEVDGMSPGGMEVRIISKPQQPAKETAKSLGVSAMAQLQAGKVEPVEIVWPKTESAWFLEYEATVPIDPAKPEETSTFATATLVLDLADGSQVQVNALAPDDPKLARRAVSTTVSTVEPKD